MFSDLSFHFYGSLLAFLLCFSNLMELSEQWGEKTELTKNMKHNGSTALSYLVGGSADVLSIVCPGNRPYCQLAAV